MILHRLEKDGTGFHNTDRFIFQMFNDVSVLFSDVVGFTKICSLISPMEVVTMLNHMYTSFDQISEEHNVYKVRWFFLNSF